jgi:arginine decarboxylase
MKFTAKTDLDLADFFSATEARNDRWRSLHRAAKALAAKPTEKLRAQAAVWLAELGPLEEFQGYPGPRLMALVRERAQTGDWNAFARLVQRISAALLADSYQEDVKAWREDDEGEAYVPDTLPTSRRSPPRK